MTSDSQKIQTELDQNIEIEIDSPFLSPVLEQSRISQVSWGNAAEAGAPVEKIILSKTVFNYTTDIVFCSCSPFQKDTNHVSRSSRSKVIKFYMFFQSPPSPPGRSAPRAPPDRRDRRRRRPVLPKYRGLGGTISL